MNRPDGRGTGEAVEWCARVSAGTAEARVRERVRSALEGAVRQRVSTVTVDRDGNIKLTDPLTAALDRLHGHVVATWTFAPEPWETVSQGEIDYATDVLAAAWVAAKTGAER